MHTFTSQIKASQTKVLKNIKNINQRRLKFLELTASFYNKTNRRVVNKSRESYCLYSSSKDSPGCAIGRWVSKDSDLDFDTIAPVYSEGVFRNLPKWMQEMGKKFLCTVQLFHDSDCNWNEKGLSNSGNRIYEDIKTRINSGTYES